MNDAVEFIGILSMDPSVARAGFEDSAMMSAEGAAVELDFVAQVKTKLFGIRVGQIPIITHIMMFLETLFIIKYRKF